MVDFTIKTGDTAPPLEQTLEDFEGNPVDLTSASVTFKMRHFKGAPVALTGQTNNDQVGNGEDGSLGFVSFEWGEGDLDVPGAYEGEWEVTFNGGEVETFPNDRYVRIRIRDDIAEAAS